LIFALCAKCRILVKDREDALVGAFLETLVEMEPRLARSVAARAWRGDRDGVDLRDFDLVVAFGSDRTLKTISANVEFPTRLIAYPSRTSAGYVCRDAMQNERACEAIAAAAARDALLYDGEGCLSLHVLFVERGAAVSSERFGEIIGSAMEAAAREFPSSPEPQRSAARALQRDVAAFRAAVADRVFSDDPPSLLPRSLDVVFVDERSQALDYLRRHHVVLEALAVAQPDSGDAEFAVRTGAARIARLGSLQDPPLGTFHGGRPRIAEFVRWISDDR
jgi:Acyl-CoA reductase (LuxC)